MDDTDRPNLPDIETVVRYARAKRRSAVHKMQQAKHYARRSADLEREAANEMQEVEAFERLLKSIPQSEDELRRLEQQGNAAMHGMQMSHFYPANANRMLFAGGGEPDAASFRTQRDMVAAACFQILSDGSWRSTEDLLEEMTKRGVQLTAANKLQRLSQILSMAPTFKNERGRGWALDLSSVRGELLRNDNAEGEPERDPRMLARAKELARDDGNSAR